MFGKTTLILALMLGLSAALFSSQPAECHGCAGYCSEEQLVCPIGCACNFVTNNCF